MQTKTKIIIGIIVLIILMAAGIILNINSFISIQKKDSSNAADTLDKIKENTQISKQDPVLELTQETVELEVGAVFSYIDFIKKAEDAQGYNLKDKVKAPDDIPTDVPGEYQITYTLELSNGKSISRMLNLEVIEPQISDMPDGKLKYMEGE